MEATADMKGEKSRNNVKQVVREKRKKENYRSKR